MSEWSMETFAPHVVERFWRTVTVSPSGCWEWSGKLFGNGYGSFYRKGRYYLAHRVSVALTSGPIPAGKVVCHSCDNRKCVNPDHLSVGTQKENMQDMVRKGRANPARGAAAGKAKLTTRSVKAIRAAARRGVPFKELAKQHRVSGKQISVIVSRKQWAHV